MRPPGVTLGGGRSCLYGDTGWRDISDLLGPDWEMSASAPRCVVRRVGAQVWYEFRVRLKGPTGNSHRLIDPVPAGFQCQPYQALVSVVQSASTLPSSALLTQRVGKSLLDVRGANWTTGGELVASAVGLAADPWPTSLPVEST